MTAIATISANSVLTSTKVNEIIGGINGFGGLFVRKTVQENLTSSAVQQDDDELVMAVAAASIYTVDVTLFASSAANAAGDIQVGYTFPSGASLLIGGFGLDTTLPSGSNGPIQTNGTGPVSGAAIAGYGLSTTSTTIRHSGIIIVSSTAGNLRVQWSQFISNANATSVLAGSYMILTKVG